MSSSATVPWGVVDVLLGVVLTAVAGAALVAGALLLDRLAPLDALAVVLLTSAALQAAFLGVALRFTVGRYGASAQTLGFGQAVGLAAWTAPFAGLAASIVLTAVYVYAVDYLGVTALAPPDLPQVIQEAEGVRRLAAAFVVIVIGPVAEETFFRGFVFQGLRARLGALGAAVASAALFGAVHGEVGLLIPAFMSGLVFTWVFVRTGRLGPAILAHSLQNFLAFIAA